MSAGRICGLVGESGSGKSTVARALMRLVPFTGQVAVDGVNVHDPAVALTTRR